MSVYTGLVLNEIWFDDVDLVMWSNGELLRTLQRNLNFHERELLLAYQERLCFMKIVLITIIVLS